MTAPSATSAVARNARERDVAVASTCSVRPSCSSLPPWLTTAIAKQVTTSASTEITAPSRVSRNAPAPPRRCEQVLDAAGVEGVEAGRDRAEDEPGDRHADRPADQHRRVHPQAQRDRVGQPRRTGGRARARGDHPATEVATARSSHAIPTRAIASATYSSSTHHRVSLKARSWVFQPNGVSQLSQDASVVSPTARSTNSTADAPDAMPAQVRALGEIWQATSVSPVATSPVPAQHAPNASDPATGSPAAVFTSGGQHAEQHGDAGAEGQGCGERAAGDRRAAEQLGLPVLLVQPGVPAYDEEHHHRHEDGVDHGHLGHRQLAGAVHVEDRPVQRDEPGARVDRLGRLHPLGLGGVEVGADAAEASSDEQQSGVPDGDHHPVAAPASAAAARGPCPGPAAVRARSGGTHRRRPAGSVR